MSRVIIIGGVAGGMSAAARLRRLDESLEIAVFEKGEHVSFASCGLPYYIGGSIRERDGLFIQTPESFGARFNASVRTLHEVTSIDRKNKTVAVKNLADGSVSAEKYDKLVLSPGALPIRPPVPGIGHPAVFTLRNVPDTDAIRDFIGRRGPRRAVVIGGGFIGLEMAENLHSRGMNVTVVEMAPQIMNALDFEMAAIVHQHLKSKKVELYLNDGVASFADDNGKLAITLKSGRAIKADMAVLSIGVRPDTRLAALAGLETGKSGGIAVNEYLQTSDPDIYAVGDAIETVNIVTGRASVMPLAGPANKQGRMAADNIVQGNGSRYSGSIGTAIAKVFDLTVAVAGAVEKTLRAEKIPHQSVTIHPGSHAGYYPGSAQMSLKVLFSPEDGRVLGAEAVGFDGVDKRMDVLSLAIMKRLTVTDLEEFEQAYAPPYSSAKDPVNMAGFLAGNMLAGLVKPIYWDEIDALDRQKSVVLDVRTPDEVRHGVIEGATNIPVDELRARLGEVPKGKKIAVYCRVGMRGYFAARILAQNGFDDVANLSGGYLTYSAARRKQDNPDLFD